VGGGQRLKGNERMWLIGKKYEIPP
jgi:hypothetical protein